MALYNFQIEGVKRMVNQKRLILADEMGLGKTVEAIAALQYLKCKRILIICPKTLCLNWQKEFEKWTDIPTLTVGTDIIDKIISVQEFKQGVVILSYNAAQPDFTKTKDENGNTHITMDIDSLCMFNCVFREKFDAIVFDEAHKLSNNTTAQSKGGLILCEQAPIIFMLTGTPIRNKYTDLWALLHGLDKEAFPSFWSFDRQFGYARADKSMTYVPAKLRMILEQYMLRRTKKDNIDLPKKTYQDLWLEMTPDQQRIYNEMEFELMTELDENNWVMAPGILAQYIRLKQIAVSPKLIGYTGHEIGIKLETLKELISDTDDKLVICSQWTKCLDLVKEYVVKPGQYVEISGEVSASKRQENIETFQNNGKQFMLCTIGAGGVGVTLTAASKMVFIDRMYTPADNEQMVARIDRIGQDKPITILDLLAMGAIERKIEYILIRKTEIIESVLDSTPTKFSVGEED